MSCHAFFHFFSNAFTVQTCANYVSKIFMDPVLSSVSIVFKKLWFLQPFWLLDFSTHRLNRLWIKKVWAQNIFINFLAELGNFKKIYIFLADRFSRSIG